MQKVSWLHVIYLLGLMRWRWCWILSVSLTFSVEGGGGELTLVPLQASRALAGQLKGCLWVERWSDQHTWSCTAPQLLSRYRLCKGQSYRVFYVWLQLFLQHQPNWSSTILKLWRFMRFFCLDVFCWLLKLFLLSGSSSGKKASFLFLIIAERVSCCQLQRRDFPCIWFLVPESVERVLRCGSS